MSADDDSKNPESEAQQGQDAITRLEDRLDLVVEFYGELEERLGQAQAERAQLREELEAEREARKQAEAALHDRVDAVEEETDLLRLVDRVDGATGKQRSSALLQHLRRKAQQRQRDGREPVAMLDKDSATEALHHPDIDRTQFYKDMERVTRWFDDSGICWYDSGELWLDLTSTDGKLSLNGHGVKASPQFNGGSGAQEARSDGGNPKLG